MPVRGFVVRRMCGPSLLTAAVLLLAINPRSSPGTVAAQGDVHGGDTEQAGTFSIVFLQKELQFGLTPHFSSHAVAENFCIQHGLDATHVRAVREIVENAVAEALGDDRVYEGMQGRDVEARWFVESVCRDFPRLHRMNQIDEGRPYTDYLKTLTVRNEPLRIIDAFPFFNEVEMLRVRLEELSPVVDKFILVESEMTHSGQPKTLIFEENREKFEPWLEKIVHVVMEKLPDSRDHWVRERAQRDGTSPLVPPFLTLENIHFYRSLPSAFLLSVPPFPALACHLLCDSGLFETCIRHQD